MQHNKPALPWFYSWPGTIFNSLQFAHACVQGIHILNCLMHTYIYILDDCDKNNIQRSGTVVKLNSSKHKQQSRCLLPIVNFSGSLSACCIAKQKRKVCVAYCWTWSKLGARSQRTGLCKVRPLHATPSLAPTWYRRHQMKSICSSTKEILHHIVVVSFSFRHQPETLTIRVSGQRSLFCCVGRR